jgi:putative flippase GtrA
MIKSAVWADVACKAMIQNSVIKFLLVGVSNTVVGLGVIWAAKWLGASDVVANIVGYVVAVTLSFLLNKRWTFAFQGERRPALVRFLAVFGVAYAVNLGAVLSLIEMTGLDTFWCQTLGVIPYSTLFYLGSRWYAFPNTVVKPQAFPP